MYKMNIRNAKIGIVYFSYLVYTKYMVREYMKNKKGMTLSLSMYELLNCQTIQDKEKEWNSERYKILQKY